MTDHQERSHATLSASGAHRWIACPPSALLERDFPDTTSEAAQEGTLAHELAEAKVRNYFLLGDFNKRKLNAAIKKLKTNPLWQDEMMRYTDEYLDYIKATAMKFKSKPYVEVEKRVYFGVYTCADQIDPPNENEGYGIADCVMIGGDVIHIIDFKYGKSPDGRVSAEGNPQLALYALGVYETSKLLYRIKTIRMTIVQPRLSDGVSEWECPVEELLTYGKYVRSKAELAVKGEGDPTPSQKTCKFCRARSRCRARAEENVKLAFDVGKKPPLISNEEMGQYLEQGADVAKWLSDLQDCALKECLAGREVPGWKAVEGRGGRTWTDMDKAFDTLQRAGIVEEAVLWERVPLSLAKIEKLIGEKTFSGVVGDLVIKKPGNPTLVKETDKRDAITNKITAAEAFKEGNS